MGFARADLGGLGNPASSPLERDTSEVSGSIVVTVKRERRHEAPLHSERSSVTPITTESLAGPLGVRTGSEGGGLTPPHTRAGGAVQTALGDALGSRPGDSGREVSLLNGPGFPTVHQSRLTAPLPKQRVVTCLRGQ